MSFSSAETKSVVARGSGSFSKGSEAALAVPVVSTVPTMDLMVSSLVSLESWSETRCLTAVFSVCLVPYWNRYLSIKVGSVLYPNQRQIGSRWSTDQHKLSKLLR